MRLYLIRHAKAERQPPEGRDDLRAITKRGRRQASWLAAELESCDIRPIRILSSPAVRAMQTAKIVAEALGLTVEPADAVGLGAGPGDIVELIASMPETRSLAIVGHNPTLSRACDLLLGGVGGAERIELRTGQAASIDLPTPDAPVGGGTLVDLLRIPETEDAER